MLPARKKSISITILRFVAILSGASILALGGLWLASDFLHFEADSARIRSDYLEARKREVKQQIDLFQIMIEEQQANLEKNLRANIRQRTLEAWAVADSLHRHNAGRRPPEEIANMVREALRPIRYNNGRGYFFATNLNGTEELFTDQPQLEGKNLLGVKDLNGKPVIQDMIAIAREHGEGFYEYLWTKPETQGRGHRKLAFVKYFPPLDWFIGTGDYLDDAEADLGPEILRLMEYHQFGDKGYIFACTLDGWFLSGPFKGENLFAHPHVNPEKVSREITETARTGGGFVEYVRPPVGNEPAHRKVSYITPVTPWGWYMGAGVNVEAVETEIARQRAQLWTDMRQRAMALGILLSLVLTGQYVLARWASGRLQDNLKGFMAAFRDAEASGARLDPEILPYVELENLALSANAMIEGRVQAERALRDSEAKFVHLFQSSPDAIILTHLESGRITEANTACAATFGRSREDMLNRTTGDLGLYLDPRKRETLLALIREKKSIQNQSIEIRHADGAVLACLVSSKVLAIDGEEHAITTFHDITEQKKIQEMMIQTEKMMSVGGIAAGIAHEINNPLGIILQTAQNLALRTLPDFPKNQEAAAAIGLDLTLMERYMKARKLDVFIEQIQAAGSRAATIVRNMLDFSRRSEAHRGQCDVRGIIEKAITLAESDYDLRKSYDFKQIQIEIIEQGRIPAIACTETEIEQVVLNILRNAAQAMAGHPVQAPRIVIRLSGANQGVRIEIEDNGPGIPPEIQRRIFEPFFTTKKPGEGTGLGLSVSYFIITQGHGGAISVTSQPGHGTCFRIDLPVTPEQKADEGRG